VTNAKRFTTIFNRMMENIREIDAVEIFVAVVDEIDPKAMFDLKQRDLSAVFSDGSIVRVQGRPDALAVTSAADEASRPYQV
jgi:hypothetical protein